jgi:hypothetical protein
MVRQMATDLAGPVDDALGGVVRVVPKLLLFLLIIVLGWLAAKAVRTIVDKLLERVGFDRVVERGGVGRMLAQSRYDASGLLAMLAYYAILLLALQLAFGVWGPNPVSDLIRGIVAWLPRAAVAIVIVVVAAAIANGVRDLVAGALGGLSYGRLLANVVAAFILGVGVIAALNQIGVATTVTTPILIAVLATIAGILIVGVGGGLVAPMQRRWEGWLSRLESETPEVSQRLRQAAEVRRAGTQGAGTGGAGGQAAGAQGAGPDPTSGAAGGSQYRQAGGLPEAPTMVMPIGRPAAPTGAHAAPPAPEAVPEAVPERVAEAPQVGHAAPAVPDGASAASERSAAITPAAPGTTQPPAPAAPTRGPVQAPAPVEAPPPPPPSQDTPTAVLPVVPPIPAQHQPVADDPAAPLHGPA